MCTVYKVGRLGRAQGVKSSQHQTTNQEQVQQVRVGIDAGSRGLDLGQLLQDGIQLLGLGQVHLALLWVGPVRERHVDRYEVLEVHAQDGETETSTLGEALAVAAVVPTGRDQLHQLLKHLREAKMGVCCITRYDPKPQLDSISSGGH